MNKQLKLILGALAVLGLTAIPGRAVPADPKPADNECAQDLAPNAANDEWIAMQLETAYLFNPHLSDLLIDTEVKNGYVMLSGTVRSDIDRDLAEEIARSLDGVESVGNTLTVQEELEVPAMPEPAPDFVQKVKDVTTTAQVKTRLIGNGNIAAGDIDVDTENNVVRLSGEVRSDTERQLAELIARNTSGVQSVFNELEIRRSG